ncbi:unnamed protein product [Eruca vesicaria subsp. sativa]|uniref:Uncharacterized protein n=1 Tax=Eruca vesicaria subsp. sativa TaxID=29727 RepID=A0ABC8JCJ0_ERUVS|nr:unnamed protein product [Eruca vesicaria subsp. sativa]
MAKSKSGNLNNFVDGRDDEQIRELRCRKDDVTASKSKHPCGRMTERPVNPSSGVKMMRQRTGAASFVNM